jgi:hypothetical protein
VIGFNLETSAEHQRRPRVFATIQLKRRAAYACGVTRALAGKHKLNKNRTNKIRVFTKMIANDNTVSAGY